MYHVGKRIHHHRRLRHIALFVLIVTAGGFGTYWLLHLRTTPHASIHNAPPLSTSYTAATPSKVQIDEPLFTLELPAGWQAGPPNTDVNIPTYTFRSPSAKAQQLAIFIDSPPATLAVNRVVVVSPQGNGLQYGEVSDNCVTFTKPTPAETAAGVAAGKWQGADFLCDIGNYERDVVGIASSAGVNTVTLSGPKSGTHQIFMAYTDNNINPDFSTLYSILDSFRLR